MFVYEGGSPGIKVKTAELKQDIIKALEAKTKKAKSRSGDGNTAQNHG